MKIHYFSGDILLESPLHIGSGEAGEHIDCPVQRDSDGIPIIPGTSLCGLMASIARDCLRFAGTPADKLEDEPVFRFLFGSARETEGGQESRLVVLDAAQNNREATTFIQDRTSIDRERGSAEENHLFNDELIPTETQFCFRCEFREKIPLESSDSAVNINAEALKLLKNIIGLMSDGWYALGGKGGTGRGQFKIDNLAFFIFDRNDPDNVLEFALNGYNGLKKRQQPVSDLKTDRIYTPEVLVIEGTLSPLEPILVKAGYSSETVTPEGHRTASLETMAGLGQPVIKEISVDAAFCKDHRLLPFVPGSSIRGSVRSYGERMVRSIIYEKCKGEGVDDEGAEFVSNHAAWDVKTAKDMGDRIIKENLGNFEDINNRTCIVSRLFGFTALGGRLSFSDAFPIASEEFKKGLKLLDHVAIDRFTGGAARGKKFNAVPFFPSYPVGTFPGDKGFPDERGDMKFRVILRDFEKWHLGFLLLLINDLFHGRIKLGYGTRKGFGRIKLMADSIVLSGLTSDRGVLKGLADNPENSTGGSLQILKTIKSCESFWVAKEDPFYHIAGEAVKEFRTMLLKWQSKPQPVGGEV